MHLKQFIFITTLCLFNCIAASAAVTVGATRIIYDGAANEANLTVNNSEETFPYLVQSWVSRFGNSSDESVDNFIVTPPLFRLDANSENILRIIFAGSTEVPDDRESLFLMNVKAIPAMSDDQKGKNMLQIALKTTIKLFYRPAGLQGSPKDAIAQLKLIAKPGLLDFNNSSNFHLVISEMKLNGQQVIQVPDLLLPGKNFELPIHAKTGDEVLLSYIDDYGSTVTAPVIRIN